ncbi:tRNA (guanine-N(7)-)-methyltransferase non-catalytic subunit wuho [Papilio machaon]|uniref:tRNA (guanine-N(7)-)-methyltransferase non-catalytic subunit wuho n=1 Tax=Papilio machaon TaxID=76193 RepID=UPI001E663266|nr:tRNA (guanine-N(7)-)-methyltransferase non-catalytic subunit wuho [Papilio machaon]
MTSIAVNKNIIAIARHLHIDCYDYSNHKIIDVESQDANDSISDIVIASNCEYIAIITSTSKQLIIYNWPTVTTKRKYVLPRSASKIRFSPRSDHIFVADKTGDVLKYDISKESDGIKLLGHLSLLLNVLQTSDSKFIISSDRDEKIRVSCYPNTYNIHTYCLGHTEFVNHLEFLPHDNKYLTSTSGDGTIRCWDYVTGKMHHSIDTFLDINDETLKSDFAKVMIEEGIEVKSLPIVHYAITKIDESCSILAIAVYNFNKILVYSLNTDNKSLKHRLLEKIDVEQLPSSLALYGSSLFVYFDVKGIVLIYTIKYENTNISLELDKTVQMFVNDQSNGILNLENKHPIKLLYKRKFDNVQEYQERKKQRLGKV